MKPAPSWIAFAPALFVVLWATGFVVARLSADHVEPLTFLSIRFLIAGALFVAIALSQRATWPNGTHAFHAAVAGALLHGGYLGPIYWAVAHGMPAGVSALIVGLQPLMKCDSQKAKQCKVSPFASFQRSEVFSQCHCNAQHYHAHGEPQPHNGDR